MERRTDSLHSPYWLVLVGAVITSVYWLLFSNSFNLPRGDDYDIILTFMNGYVGVHGVLPRLSYYLASQHNEYKLFLVHAIVIVQHAVTGTVNFAVLQCLGDLGLLGIFAVLSLHLPGKEQPWRQGLLLLPLAFLSFSLRPLETLNWAGPGLQNVSVVVFSLLAIHFLTMEAAGSGAAACACVALAIAASGNGLFVLCSGTLALLERGRYRLLAPWLLTGALCAGCYAYRYTPVVKQPAVAVSHGVGATLLFPLAFLGNTLSSPPLAIAYAAALLGTFVFLVRRGLRQKAPFVFHAVIFVLLTAAGVSLTRHSGGLAAAVPSRYALYSLLLTSLIYIGILCSLQVTQGSVGRPALLSTQRLPVVAGFAVVSSLLWAHHMILGSKLLAMERNGIQESFVGWQHGTRSNPVYISPLVHSKDLEELGHRAAGITVRAMESHVFVPEKHDASTTPHPDR